MRRGRLQCQVKQSNRRLRAQRRKRKAAGRGIRIRIQKEQEAASKKWALQAVAMKSERVPLECATPGRRTSQTSEKDEKDGETESGGEIEAGR